MKAANILLSCLVIAVICGAIYFLVPAYTQYCERKSQLQKIQQKVTRNRQSKKLLQQKIHALREDPEAVERVAREKFGWCRPGEKVYHFETSPRSILPRRDTHRQDNE